MRAVREPRTEQSESVWGGRRSATRLDVQRRQQAAEEAGVARCPCCRFALVARMGRRGPGFPCLCRGRG
jgi:hypothetical protein